jgi:hypothetical protein
MKASMPTNVQNYVSLVILFPFWFVLFTPFEYDSSTYVVTVRFTAMLLFLLGFSLVSGVKSNLPTLIFGGGVIEYLVILNIGHDIQYCVALVMFIAGGLVIGSMFYAYKDLAIKIVSLYLMICIISVVINYVAYYIFGILLDLHSTVLPFGPGRQDSIGFQRFSGVHIEPGTYVQWVFASVVILSVLQRQIGWLCIAAVTSAAMTLSTWALGAMIVFVGALMSQMLIRRGDHRHSRTAFLTSLPFLVVFAAAYLTGYLDDYIGVTTLKLNESSRSYQFRETLYEMFWWRVDEMIFFGNPVSDSFCSNCESVNDIGLWANFFWTFGIIPAMALLAFLAYTCFRVFGLSVAAILMMIWMTKAPVYEPFIWILIGILISSRKSIQPQTRIASHDPGVPFPWRQEASL